MSEDVKRMGRELAYQGTVLKVYKDHMKFSNGNTEDWDFIHHDGAAAVIPVMDDGKTVSECVGKRYVGDPGGQAG